MGSDQLNDSVETVNPDGTVGADFTGHVHAAGLDLDAGTSTTPPTSSRVRWLRTTDGAVIADLYGVSTAPADRALIVDAGATRFSLSDGLSRNAFLTAGAESYLIGDAAGNSRFTQVEGAPRPIAFAFDDGTGELQVFVDGNFVGALTPA